jgi:hypothetical protein
MATNVNGSGDVTVEGPVTVSDGSGPLTIDGTVAVSTVAGTVTIGDGGATISIDDGAGSLTVDGTVTVNIGTTNGLALDTTATNGTQKTKLVDSGGTNTATVSAGGALKVDGSAVTQPVSLAGTQAVSDSTAQTKLDTVNTNLAHLTDGTQTVHGTVASGAPDSGNPLKIGGKYNSTAPTYADGQRTELQSDTKGSIKTNLRSPNGTTDASINTLAADAVATSMGGLSTQAFEYRYNGATWDRQRSATIFKTITATASGDTALWTPTSGKKFRIMRYMVEITANAATSSGAEIDVVLRDNTTVTPAAFSVYVPAVAVTTAVGRNGSGWIDFGNGILSATINNVLNVNLSATLTSGKVRIVVCGTEE